MRLHVRPTYEGGKSKLKIVETVGEKWPLKPVLRGVSGWFLSTGTIKCGNSKSPERSAEQDPAGEDGAGWDGVVVTVANVLA